MRKGEMTHVDYRWRAFHFVERSTIQANVGGVQHLARRPCNATSPNKPCTAILARQWNSSRSRDRSGGRSGSDP